MRRQGVPEHVIDEMESRAATENVFEIWPENVPVVDVFVALASQWNRAGMSGEVLTGINYTAVPVVMDLLGVPPKKRRRYFEWIRLMEAEAREVANRK